MSQRMAYITQTMQIRQSSALPSKTTDLTIKMNTTTIKQESNCVIPTATCKSTINHEFRFER